MGPLVGGVCIIPSVLSHRSKDLKWWTSITAQLQLSFIWQAKDSTPWRCEGGRPQRTGLNPSWLPPFIRLSPPLSMSYVGGLFVLPEVLTPALRFSFVPF